MTPRQETTQSIEATRTILNRLSAPQVDAVCEQIRREMEAFLQSPEWRNHVAPHRRDPLDAHEAFRAEIGLSEPVED